MPGQKDCISVEVDGMKIKIQKRLLLLNLNELYVSFKESYPDEKIGFSTFAKLHPKHCVLAGANGIHSVCVCIIHQNCKLMLDAINIAQLAQGSKKVIFGYKECLEEMMCNKRKPQCHLDQCKDCPGIETFSSTLLGLLEKENYNDVEYNLWMATDRCRLELIRQNNADFVNTLCDKLRTLKPHSFIAKEQTNFIADKKKNLKVREALVMFDFSENYAFTAQDAAQAFHFNNDQCTVFPVIYYYRINSDIIHKSCVFLSDSLNHDTAAVYTIQNLLIPEIRKDVRKLKKIFYVTDGAKQHFKNRYQIANLLCHEDDFQVEAEWHFCATAHGKSCYDGIGATFKREAYRASLTTKPKNAILTHDVLFKWALNHFKSLKCFYFSKAEHEKMRRRLNKRFELAKPVPEILKNHSFQVVTPNELMIKRYSNATSGVKVTM